MGEQMEELMERLGAAAAALERVAERMAEQQVALAAEAEQSVGRIVATVENQRETELLEKLRVTEERLLEAESKLAQLSAAAGTQTGERKTLSSGTAMMLAKQGVQIGDFESEAGRVEAGSLDAALGSLSIEQRFAVKGEMLRAGLLG